MVGFCAARLSAGASDLRNPLATVKLGSPLENISDQAVDIARRIRALIQESVLEKDAELTSIFEQVDSSISEALEAFAAARDPFNCRWKTSVEKRSAVALAWMRLFPTALRH